MKKTDFFPINVDEYEHNYSAPIENIYTHEKKMWILCIICIGLQLIIQIKEGLYLIILIKLKK